VERSLGAKRAGLAKQHDAINPLNFSGAPDRLASIGGQIGPNPSEGLYNVYAGERDKQRSVEAQLEQVNQKLADIRAAVSQ
jgi:hypothetical protein